MFTPLGVFRSSVKDRSGTCQISGSDSDNPSARLVIIIVAAHHPAITAACHAERLDPVVAIGLGDDLPDCRFLPHVLDGLCAGPPIVLDHGFRVLLAGEMNRFVVVLSPIVIVLEMEVQWPEPLGHLN
jgi:hypothetical protein